MKKSASDAPVEGRPGEWAISLAEPLGLEIRDEPSWLPVPLETLRLPRDVIYLDGWLELAGDDDPVRLAIVDRGPALDTTELHIECGRQLANAVIQFLAAQLQDKA